MAEALTVVREWTIYLHNKEKDTWLRWSCGTLERVMDEYFVYLSGIYGDKYDQARLESPMKEG